MNVIKPIIYVVTYENTLKMGFSRKRTPYHVLKHFSRTNKNMDLSFKYWEHQNPHVIKRVIKSLMIHNAQNNDKRCDLFRLRDYSFDEDLSVLFVLRRCNYLGCVTKRYSQN